MTYQISKTARKNLFQTKINKALFGIFFFFIYKYDLLKKNTYSDERKKN